MQIEQRTWDATNGWNAPAAFNDAGLVLVFGTRVWLAQPEHQTTLRAAYPQAAIVGCSTAGEIAGTQVSDDTLAVTALRFASTSLQTAVAPITHADQSHAVGVQLAQRLPAADLAHVLVLADGQLVNGSELVRGLTQHLPAGVAVTGGLAGDGPHFGQTLVYANQQIGSGLVIVVGFYGARLRVGYASCGGWEPFGPDRRVTRSDGSTLYELDGQSALALYKQYLGPHAVQLPASALRFPLLLLTDDLQAGVVRTILQIDEQQQSMRFAGDLPIGARVRLMHAKFDRLIDGAEQAAQLAVSANTAPTTLGLLISCVGRKLVLQQRVEEEVEAVSAVLGPQARIAGFYSYGEIAPARQGVQAELHNQTMTITTFTEV